MARGGKTSTGDWFDSVVTWALPRFLDPLSRCLDAESARRVLALGVPASVQERVDVLAERANEGLLSDDQRTEYEALINAEDFLAILKLKARRQLAEAL